MKDAQRCITRWLAGRRFYRELCQAAGEEEDGWEAWQTDGSPLSCLELTEYTLDRLLDGLARDRLAETMFATLVRGRQFCVERFWTRFPATLMTWVRSCRWQKILGRVDFRKLDPRTRRMLRQINREANTVLARRLNQLDPAGLAERIDAATGIEHANIVAIYTVAYLLRTTPPLWREFRHQLMKRKGDT